MKKILLVSNYVFHYRSKIYNFFYEKFLERGYEFHVLSNSYQKVDFDIEYKQYKCELNFNECKKIINIIKPNVIITFLHLKDRLIYPITFYYSKIRRIPVIYWNHGVNLEDANNKLKNIVFKTIHTLSDAIILYTPNEIKYINKFNQKKVFIAYNTLDFENEKYSNEKAYIKNQYGINEDFIVLFVARIIKRKRLDILLKTFKNTNIGVAIVGPGITKEYSKIINDNHNFYYLGELYGTDVNNVFNMSDVYSTPGHIGLGLNQAFYWGLPVVVLEGNHAPEIYYMKEGKTGYIVNNSAYLKEKILFLSNNEEELNNMSYECKNVIRTEASIDSMFKGFLNAVEYLQTKGCKR